MSGNRTCIFLQELLIIGFLLSHACIWVLARSRIFWNLWVGRRVSGRLVLAPGSRGWRDLIEHIKCGISWCTLAKCDTFPCYYILYAREFQPSCLNCPGDYQCASLCQDMLVIEKPRSFDLPHTQSPTCGYLLS